MFCQQCGREITTSSNYCAICGAHQSANASYKRLTLSATDSKIAGVCGGIAEYLDVDPTVVRLIWLVLSIVPGVVAGGVVAYVVAWIIIPKAHAQSAAAALQTSPK